MKGASVQQLVGTRHDIKMNVWLSDSEFCRGQVLLSDTLRSLYLPYRPVHHKVVSAAAAIFSQVSALR